MASTAHGSEAGDKRSGRGLKRRSSHLLRPCCFRPAADETAGADGGADRGGGGAAAATAEARIPTHLIVTVNGIIGSAANWRFAAKKFVERYPEDVIVHCSECNCSTLTFDGVDVMGERLAEEVMSVVAHRPELQKISFVCHSLGGLIARYAIGRLYEETVVGNFPDKNREVAESLQQKVKGKIAGLDPINFITFATPHIGSRFHKQIPLFGGSYVLEKMAYHISWIAGRSGKHLFLKDSDDGKPPLLFQMVNDRGDLKFMSALRSFRRRVAYSNVHFDLVVGWRASSIRHQHDLPKSDSFTRNDKYPHVVHEEIPNYDCEPTEDVSETMVCQPKTISEMEEVMINCLNRVPWERVDVSFRKSKQRFMAHSTIQVKTYAVNSDGADVIYHMIDNFHL